jgi:hypothetical protein
MLVIGKMFLISTIKLSLPLKLCSNKLKGFGEDYSSWFNICEQALGLAHKLTKKDKHPSLFYHKGSDMENITDV